MCAKSHSSAGNPLPSEHIPAPRISVIILTYNSRHWLADLVASISPIADDVEIIVADNQSSDGSLEYVAACLPQARCVQNGGNVGYAGGNNRAAAFARGEFLVFLNPDTKVRPGSLTALVRPFADSSVGLVAAKVVLLSEPQKVNSCGLDVHLTGLTLCRGMNAPEALFSEPGPVTAVSGSAFAIRREVFAASGGFPELFFMYQEDTALSLDAWLRGWRVVYMPDCVVEHDYRLRIGREKLFLLERNRYFLLLQTYRWPTLVVLLPSLLLAEVLSWGFVVIHDRPNWKNKFRAYIAVLREWPAVRAHRRRNQADRRVQDRDLLRLTTWRLDFTQVGKGLVARTAPLVFCFLFRLLRGLTLWVVRW